MSEEPPAAPLSLHDPQAEQAGIGPCARLVKRHDPDRYLLAITAPPPHRPALFALYAFNAEVSKTREVVSEAMLGEIRLQWWRDALAECFAGTPRRHEVVEPLSVAITQAAPARALLEQLIDARARDLDDAPVETMADFEAYARDTSGGLIRAAAQMIGAPETDAGIQAATDIGIAYALIGQVRALPFSLPARRVMLPQAVFADGGAGPEVLEAARPDPSITAACGKFLDRAADLLRDARARRADVPGQAAPAFQAARLCRSYLNQLRRCRGDPFDGRLLTPPVWRALSVGFGAKTGRW